MASFQSKFHIDDSGPEDIYEYLDTLEAHSPKSSNELADAAADLGHGISQKERIFAGNTLVRMGVVDPEDKFTFTELGNQLVDIMYSDPEIFNNLLHYLFYTAYDRYPDRHVYASYTYKMLTNYLYDNGPFTSFTKGDIIGDVSAEAEADSNLNLSKTSSGVSMSTKTFNNFWQFLEALKPTVQPEPEVAGFERRSFCPPGLFVLAVNYAYNQTDSEFGSLLQATDKIETIIKQVCLLNDDGLNEVIDFAESSYSFFSTKHDFGLQFRLEEEVSIRDIK